MCVTDRKLVIDQIFHRTQCTKDDLTGIALSEFRITNGTEDHVLNDIRSVTATGNRHVTRVGDRRTDGNHRVDSKAFLGNRFRIIDCGIRQRTQSQQDLVSLKGTVILVFDFCATNDEVVERHGTGIFNITADNTGDTARIKRTGVIQRTRRLNITSMDTRFFNLT